MANYYARASKKLSIIENKNGIKEGNILNATEDYIMHQTNCLTTNAAGLAAALFKKFPYANIYKTRLSGKKDRVGTIKIIQNIIHCFGQYYPGKPKYREQEKKRYRWFLNCLKLIESTFKNNTVSIAYPYKIGCGMAGGNWDLYYDAIKKCDEKNSNITLIMYKF